MRNRRNSLITKKSVLWAIVLLALLIPLFFLRQLTEERQIVEREAVGTGEVRMHIQPTNVTVDPGERFETNIVLTKTADRSITISGAQAVIVLTGPISVVTEDDISCGPEFDGLVFKQISGQTVTIMCTVSPGSSNVINLTTADVLFATVAMTVDGSAAGQSASVQFNANRVTEANDQNEVPDVSTAGETATYTISGSQTTSTPTTQPTDSPTATPQPTDPPTATPTDSPPTATATPIPNCENQKTNGDYNCDGVVNEQDFSDWWSDFLNKLTSLRFFEYWRRVFFRSNLTPSPTDT